MKSYRCVFNYAGGNTTIDVTAGDGERAIEVAAAAISAGDYDGVEVWDGDDLLLTRTTRRAWDALGSPEIRAVDGPNRPASVAEPPPPTPTSHPRRALTSFAASLKERLPRGKHWQPTATRKG